MANWKRILQPWRPNTYDKQKDCTCRLRILNISDMNLDSGNENAPDSKFNIIECKSMIQGEGSYARRSKLVGYLEDENRALSVTSTNDGTLGYTVYCLVDNSNAYETLRVLEKNVPEFNYSIRRFSDYQFAKKQPSRPAHDKRYILVRLLLNRLVATVDETGYRNLDTELIIFGHELKEAMNKKDNKDVVSGIQITVKDDCSISVNVVTFTRRSVLLSALKKKNEKSHATALKKPVYRYDEESSCLERINGKWDEERDDYFIRGVVNDTVRHNLWDMSWSDNSIEVCKQKVLRELIDCYNTFYEGFSHISFEEVKIKNIEGIGSVAKRTQKKIKHYQEAIGTSKRFNIVNKLDETDLDYECAKILCDSVQSTMEGLKPIITQSKEAVKEAFNIVLVHDKDTYKNSKNKDRYFEIVKGAAIQHITAETIRANTKKGKLSAAITSVLTNELLVKEDLLKNQFSFDWEKDFGYNLTCIKKLVTVEKNEAEKEIKINYFFVIRIKNDGSFSFQNGKIESFVGQELEVIRAMDDKVQNDNIGLIYDGRILAVYEDTDVGVTVELDGINDNLGAGFGLRGKDARRLLFSGLFDISSFSYDGNDYIISGKLTDSVQKTKSGTIGRYKIARNIRARRINYLNGRNDELQDIIVSQLNNVYIGKDRINVYPLPAKYLNEYMRSWCLERNAQYVEIQENEDGIEQDDDDEHHKYIQLELFPSKNPKRQNNNTVDGRMTTSYRLKKENVERIKNGAALAKIKSASQMMDKFIEDEFTNYLQKILNN